jgi:hypothetical protein
MNKNQHEGHLFPFSENMRPVRLQKSFLSEARLLPDTEESDPVAHQTEKFHPQAVGLLYLAIVNRALLDVLENGKNSPAAERWLLSKDFDRLQKLSGAGLPAALR